MSRETYFVAPPILGGIVTAVFDPRCPLGKNPLDDLWHEQKAVAGS